MSAQRISISDSTAFERDGQERLVVMIADPKEVNTADPEAPLVDDGDIFWNAERGAETIHWADPANEYSASGNSVDLVLDRRDDLSGWKSVFYELNDTDCLDCDFAQDRAVLAQIIWHGMAAAYPELKSIDMQYERTAAGWQMARVAVYLNK